LFHGVLLLPKPPLGSAWNNFIMHCIAEIVDEASPTGGLFFFHH
jgi:hypothetical protein